MTIDGEGSQFGGGLQAHDTRRLKSQYKPTTTVSNQLSSMVMIHSRTHAKNQGQRLVG